MATQNSSDQQYVNNSDGFGLGGGTTARTLTVTGANITLTGSGTNVYTFPAATDTLVGRTSTDTLTNKTLTSPILTTPALGTPASGVATNLTGTASGLTAGTVTTNANLTGPITSSGNATSIASQTGTGTKFVVDTSPTLVTPNIGVATGTSLTLGGVAVPTISSTSIFTNKDLTSTTNTFPSTLLGYVQRTTNFTTSSTTAVQVTSLTLTVTIPSGRSIEIKVYAEALFNTAAAYNVISIWDGTVGTGTRLAQGQSYQSTATAASTTITASAIVSGVSGSKTYNVGMLTNTGTATMEAGATNPSYLVVTLL